MPDRQQRNPRERDDGDDVRDGGNSGDFNDHDHPADATPADTTPDPTSDESDAARRRRRAQFLRELHEAKALRERVKPRQARAARMRQQMRMRTFRW